MRTAILAVVCVSAAALACSDAPPTSQDLYGTGLVPADSIESIEITTSTPSIRVGGSAQLTAVARDIAGTPIDGVQLEWTSSNTTIATVTSAGLVRGIGVGTATIKAKEPKKGKSAVAPITVTASPLMSISVSLSKSSIAIGQTSTATASLRDSSGATVTNKPVAWSTSNSSVASVNDAGLVIALAPGTSSISAAADGVTGGQAVTVVIAPVASVIISPVSASLITGGTFQLSASMYDADNQLLSGRTVAWSSSNSSVASVSSSGGLVTAVGPGSATITATSEGKTATSAITVNAPPAVPVASVSVSLAASTLTAGQTTQATATTRDAAGNVLTGRGITWTSSNTAVARVNSTGLIQAVGAGSATIQATSEGVNGSASLTVNAVPVATVSVSLAATSLTAGQTTQASATLKDAGGTTLTGRSIAWSSSNTSIATVNSSGQVTAVAAGTANIVATSEGKTGSASLAVTAAPVANVTVALGNASLTSGQTTQATATLKDAAGNVLTGRTITWGSSNTAVATVNASGLVTAIGGGTTSITATSEGQAGATTLTVTAVPVATVSVSLASANLTVSQTTQATATLKDAAGNTLTGRPITWASATPSVATVSANGLVTAIAAGTANIVATSEGKSGQATVTVTAPQAAPVATVTLSPASTSLSIGRTSQLTATLKDASGNTLTGRTISWSSSGTGIATVNGSGLVSAVALGSATITATSEGKSGTASVTVVDIVAPGPGVPVYDPANTSYVQHVFEDWSSYTSVNDIGTRSRVDGGGPWDGNGSFKSFSTDNNDPWFGQKTLTVDYLAAPGSGQSLGHGLNLTEMGQTPRQYLNAANAKEALVIEWAWRFSGTSVYIGKIADWQPYAGTDRFNYQTQYDPLGAQRSNNGPSGCDADPLCSKYYTNGTPKVAGTLPLGGWGVGFARGLSGSSPTPGVWFYTQNRGYPQVAWGSNGVNMLDNRWHRTIIRLTLNQNGVMGTGRIEEWHEVAGSAPVKVMEYIGDVGGFDQGLIMGRDANLGGNTWFTPGSTLHWYNLSAVGGIFNGGANVHLGYFRMWSMPRQ